MAYKYFTKDLLGANIPLITFFPEKQARAKDMNNTNYSFPEIVVWLKDNTDNFKKMDSYLIDLDEAVRRIVFSYYDAKNLKNPFINFVEDTEDMAAQQVRTSSTVGEERKRFSQSKPATTVIVNEDKLPPATEVVSTETETAPAMSVAKLEILIKGYKRQLAKNPEDKKTAIIIKGYERMLNKMKEEGKMAKGGKVMKSYILEIQAILDGNKDNIGLAGTDSFGTTVIADKEDHILWSKYTGKDYFLNVENNKAEWLSSYAQGGGIPNNYAGKTPQQVWDKWTEKQRIHFISDHETMAEYRKIGNEIHDKPFDKLPEEAQFIIKTHVEEGQYEGGGAIKYSKGDEGMYKGDEVRVLQVKDDKYSIANLEDGDIALLDANIRDIPVKEFESYFSKFPNTSATITNEEGVSSTYYGKDAQALNDIASDVSYNAKGGGVEVASCYISYLDSKNKFKETKKEFKGKEAYEKAVKWGKKNLPNFHIDMVHIEFADGGEVGIGEYKIVPMKDGRKKYVKEEGTIKHEIIVKKDGSAYVTTTDRSQLSGVDKNSQTMPAKIEDFKNLNDAMNYVRHYSEGVDGKEAELVDFDSMYDGKVKAYRSIGQPDLYYYALGQGLLTLQEWKERGNGYIVVAQAEGYPPTEVCDDWFGKEADAMKMAKDLAEGKDVAGYKKGGTTPVTNKAAMLEGDIIENWSSPAEHITYNVIELGGTHYLVLTNKKGEPVYPKHHADKVVEAKKFSKGGKISSTDIPDNVYSALYIIDSRLVDVELTAKKLEDDSYNVTIGKALEGTDDRHNGVVINIEKAKEGTNERIVYDWLNQSEKFKKGGRAGLRARGKKYWISDALSGGKNKGALKRSALRRGLIHHENEKLSMADLHKLENVGGTTGKRAHMAETLREFGEGGILEKELRKLQRDLNSHRLNTYTEGDTSEEESARKKERAVKEARFNEVLQLLRDKKEKGGAIDWVKVKVMDGYYTMGDDDGEKPMYNEAEKKLIEDGYILEVELLHNNSAERDERIIAELKEKFDHVEMIISESEYGEIHRFYVKGVKEETEKAAVGGKLVHSTKHRTEV